MSELKDALEGSPDIILLDNMPLSQIKQAVKMRNEFLQTTNYKLPNTVFLEVSGGVNLANVRQIAKAGVDRISIGALTHSAKTLDISLSI